MEPDLLLIAEVGNEGVLNSSLDDAMRQYLEEVASFFCVPNG